MKQLLFGFSICLMTVACADKSPENNTAGKTAENGSLSSKADEKAAARVPERNPVVHPLTPEQVRKLSEILPEKTVGLMVSYFDSLAFVQTDTDFARVYHYGQSVFADIEKAVSRKFPDGYTGMEALRFIDKSFALRSSCLAECTEFVLEYDLPDLQKLAKFTTGNADDAFISVKILAEGEIGKHEPVWLNFFERTWDYGGGSLLGDTSNYQFLSHSFRAMHTSKLFQKDILMLRELTIDFMEHRIYMQPKVIVLAEINRILKSKILSPAETKRISALKQLIEQDKENPPLQFDCAAPGSNCDWGG